MTPGQIYLDDCGTAYLVVRARDVGDRPRWWVDVAWAQTGDPSDYRGPEAPSDLWLEDHPDDHPIALVLP